jgi:hypothetical protein
MGRFTTTLAAAPPASSVYLYVLGCYADENNFLALQISPGAGYLMDLVQMVSGMPTTLESESFDMEWPTAGQTFTLEILPDNTVRMYRDDEQVGADATSSAGSSNTHWGIGANAWGVGPGDPLGPSIDQVDFTG